jgi:transcription termination factor NusB
MVENPAQAMAEMAEHYAPAPPLSDEDRVRVGATHELYRTVLDGAQDALKLLRDGMNGAARGRDLRDLAVTAQALLRAAREMEKHAPTDEPPSLAELEAAEAEAARIYAARKGRG